MITIRKLEKHIRVEVQGIYQTLVIQSRNVYNFYQIGF